MRTKENKCEDCERTIPNGQILCRECEARRKEKEKLSKDLKDLK
jgi:hypothetical protein